MWPSLSNWGQGEGLCQFPNNREGLALGCNTSKILLGGAIVYFIWLDIHIPFLLLGNKLPQTYQLKACVFYYLSVSVSQEFKYSLIGFFAQGLIKLKSRCWQVCVPFWSIEFSSKLTWC